MYQSKHYKIRLKGVCTLCTILMFVIEILKPR